MMISPAQPSARALTALSLLASLGSLREAADRLGVTRSALSHRIAELEMSLGVALVRKAGRKLVLTEDGERLLGSVGDALDRIDAAVRRSGATGGRSGFPPSRPSPRTG